MQNISHIIFDWDGTVMDSTQKIVNCMQIAAKNSALPVPSAADVQHIIGISLVPAISQLFDITQDMAEKVSFHYKDAFLRHDKTACDLFCGAHDTLSALQQKYTLGVATGKARRGLVRAFEATNTAKYFCTSRCADDDGVSSKPSPIMLQQLLQYWQIDASNAVMIGDTSYDMEMAKAIGMHRIGVSYGAHGVDTLQHYTPVTIINQLSELRDIFNA
ncbi:MAG: HAD-IA family hydrolase [Glaciecola sp.]